MTLRVCHDCMATISAGRSRCTTCERRFRGTTGARGYGANHRQQRSDYQQLMDDGELFACWRCSTPIDPSPRAWQLGHCDGDRTRYHGPECVPCNAATAGRDKTACPHPSHH